MFFQNCTITELTFQNVVRGFGYWKAISKYFWRISLFTIIACLNLPCVSYWWRIFRVTLHSETGLASFSCLHCQQEMKFQHIWAFAARMLLLIFFFWTISLVNLFSTRHKNLDPFQIKVGEKWIYLNFERSLFRACCSDCSQLECRAWLKLCGLDTQLLSLKQS